MMNLKLKMRFQSCLHEIQVIQKVAQEEVEEKIKKIYYISATTTLKKWDDYFEREHISAAYFRSKLSPTIRIEVQARNCSPVFMIGSLF